MSIEDEQAEQMAWFCLLMNMSPTEYLKLERREVNAFYKVYNKIEKKKNRK